MGGALWSLVRGLILRPPAWLCHFNPLALCGSSDVTFSAAFFVTCSSHLHTSVPPQRLVLRIDGWDRGSAFPSGHIVRVLGDLGDLKAEGDAVLVQVWTL